MKVTVKSIIDSHDYAGGESNSYETRYSRSIKLVFGKPFSCSAPLYESEKDFSIDASKGKSVRGGWKHAKLTNEVKKEIEKTPMKRDSLANTYYFYIGTKKFDYLVNEVVGNEIVPYSVALAKSKLLAKKIEKAYNVNQSSGKLKKFKCIIDLYDESDDEESEAYHRRGSDLQTIIVKAHNKEEAKQIILAEYGVDDERIKAIK